MIDFLYENSINIAIGIVALIVLLEFYNRFLKRRKLVVVALEASQTAHKFYYSKKIGSEELIVYSDRKYKKPKESLYAVVNPVPFDTSNHPERWLRKLKLVELHYYRINEPVTRTITDAIFIDKERKAKVLAEQGHAKKTCTDVDFCRWDYGMSLYYDIIKKCHMAGNIGFTMDKTVVLAMISTSALLLFIFMKYNGLYLITDLIKAFAP